MQPKTKSTATAITILFLFSFALASTVAGAGSTTLNPTAQLPGASVTVNGTSFGATKAVGIAFGAEAAGVTFNMNYTGTGTGPYTGQIPDAPIKPGSFVLISDTTSGAGLISTYTDVGDGTTVGSFEGATGTINYATGVWTRITTVDVTGIVTNYTATYVRYQNKVTPAAGVTTTAQGTFTAQITVPTVANGAYSVTSIDAGGNIAVSTLNVDSTIPEGLTIGAIVLLSSAALIGARYFRKPKIKT